MTVNRRQLLRQPRREAWVEINLSALEHNCRLLRQAIPPHMAIMGVLKADAYGHGVLMTLPTLEASGVDMVGVASMDEALEVRQVNADIPILVLGPTPDWAVAMAAEQRIQLTVFDTHHIRSLEACHQRTGQTTTVHIKVDTGMHRVGIDWQSAQAFIQACQANPALNVTGLFTHLASGDDAIFTTLQLERWVSVIDALDTPLPPVRHILNSAGLQLALKGTIPGKHLLDNRYSNMARLGLVLWGYAWPNARPVIGLKGRITHKQILQAGESVSYGQHFQAQHPTVVATLPLGYADGLFRALSNRLAGECKGHRVAQIGMITMDQLMWDVSSVPKVAVGDVITLLDNHASTDLTVEQWAAQLETIPYELLCALRVRLPKIYMRD